MEDNISKESENSSEHQDGRRGKIESLYKAFNDLNWDSQKELSSEDILYFLNINSQQGKFDQNLAEKFLSFLGLDDRNTITVEDFIKYYMQFDSEFQKSKEEFNNKLLIRQNSLNNLEEQCNKYKNEQLDSEGLCENAKLTVEISDIDIRIDFGDLNVVQIIIEILYNNETQQKTFDINQDDNENLNKIFEFKPRNKTDNFIISLKYVTDTNEIFEIGNKEFPVNEITTQDEYSAQIEIPENNNETNLGAIINAKILLYWSDYQYYVDKKNETELKIEKIKKSISETNKYCKEINDVYLKNMKIEPQQNMENIQWNDKIMEQNNEQKNSSFIDVDNNEYNNKLNNDDDGQRFRNNAFDINTNDDIYKNVQNPKSIFLIKVLGLSILGLGFADGFFRNEFPNQLLGTLIFLNCFNIFGGNSEKIKLCNKFTFYLCLGLLLYDIIWMFSYFSIDCDECENMLSTGHSNFAGKFTKFIVALSIIAKGFSSVILFKKK